jgi:methionyl-tRNA formyltransferase
MRIAILCNDRIALPALDQLLAARLVVAVGVPNRLHETRLLVTERCNRDNVPVHVFTKKNLHDELLQWLGQYKPDVVLVKTFPYLIPADILTIPPHGFINFHYAPLPEWRGSNPLFWLIRNRAPMGGVSVQQMNDQFDAGPVLLQQPVPLTPDINYGFFYTQLAYAGVYLTGTLLNGLKTGSLQPVEQDHSRAKWFGRPTASDLFINWNTMDAVEVRALVKACNPWNKGAGTRWNGWVFGISDASIIESGAGTNEPGKIVTMNATDGLTIACRDGKAIKAEVVYCEEGFYPGYRLSAFGLQAGNQLS